MQTQALQSGQAPHTNTKLRFAQATSHWPHFQSSELAQQAAKRDSLRPGLPKYAQPPQRGCASQHSHKWCQGWCHLALNCSMQHMIETRAAENCNIEHMPQMLA